MADPPPAAQLGAAFGLTLAASAGCLLGGSIVFVSSLVRKVDKLFLAAALALSAGVMLMVSLTEVYSESLERFTEAGHSAGEATLLSTVALFAGFALVVLLDVGLQRLDGGHGHSHGAGHSHAGVAGLGACSCCQRRAAAAAVVNEADDLGAARVAAALFAPSQSSTAGVGTLGRQKVPLSDHAATAPEAANTSAPSASAAFSNATADESSSLLAAPAGTAALAAEAADDARMKQLGLLASVAIVLHSVPEGLGTFVAAVSGSEAGFVVAIALVVHKLFEGVIVAVPQFYSSGSRCRAFAWAAVAASANPIGGLFGLLAVYRGMPSDDVFGVTYGMVAGLMTWIALGELLPSAREHDPEDRVTSRWLAAGMALMASTLVLLAYTGAP